MKTKIQQGIVLLGKYGLSVLKGCIEVNGRKINQQDEPVLVSTTLTHRAFKIHAVDSSENDNSGKSALYDQYKEYIGLF